MSESKSSDVMVIRTNLHRRKKKSRGNVTVVATDWSLSAGRLPHMNDPRVDNQVYKFIENATTDAFLTTSTTVPVASGFVWNLNNLPNVTPYTTLFDQYRIDSIEAWVVPQAQNLTALIKTVVDYDNSSTTATAAYFDAYPNCHTTTLANGHYRKFRPHMATAAYQAGGFTAYKNEPSNWLDCAYPAVTHFGLKIYTEATSAAAIPVDVITRMKVSFRNKI
jgi:hypothetical protein